MVRLRSGLPRVTGILAWMVFVLFGLVLIIVSVWGGAYQFPHFPGTSAVLDTGWSVTVEGAPSWQDVSMPIDLPGKGESILLERRLEAQLGESFDQTPAILIKTKYMDFDVLLNGTLLESYRAPQNGFSQTGGTVYRIVPLPNDWRGGTLAISGTTLLQDNIDYTMTAPLFAPAGNLLYDVISDDMPSLLCDATMLALGVMMLVGGILCGKTHFVRNRLVYSGLFAILFVLYDFCLMGTIHLLADNSYVLYVLEFFSLMTASLPLLLLAGECVNGKAAYLIHLAICLVAANFIVQALLHFLGVWELRQMLVFDHAVILISVAAIVVALLNRSKSEERHQFVYSMLPLVAGGVADMVRFYLNWHEPLNLMFRLGSMAFVLAQLYFVIRAYLTMHRTAVEAEYYQRMAYHDGLTGIQNRAAFERDVKKMESDLNRYLPLWFVVADVNGLKIINDTDGHLAGDRLLKKAAGVLTGALEDRGSLYRVGGDEFVILLPNAQEPEAEGLAERIRRESERTNAYSPRLALSVGYSCCTPDDGGILERAFSRADEKMYEEKKKSKQEAAMV